MKTDRERQHMLVLLCTLLLWGQIDNCLSFLGKFFNFWIQMFKLSYCALSHHLINVSWWSLSSFLSQHLLIDWQCPGIWIERSSWERERSHQSGQGIEGHTHIRLTDINSFRSITQMFFICWMLTGQGKRVVIRFSNIFTSSPSYPAAVINEKRGGLFNYATSSDRTPYSSIRYILSTGALWE